jgi:uncharacterized integral membrane protein (TIGR00697 family)
MRKFKEVLKGRSEFWYLLAVGASVTILIVSNLAATKLWNFFGVMLDGGIIVFPLAFLLGDLVLEIFGEKRAKVIIWVAFLMNAFVAVVLLVVQALPPGEGWGYQSDYEHILGFLPRVVVGSLVSYLASQLVNVRVFMRILAKTGEKWYFVRAIGSSIVGNIVNSLVFCGIAFGGVVSAEEWWGMVGTGCTIMILGEAILMPISYAIIGRLKNVQVRD